MAVSIEIRGLDETQRKLEQVARDVQPALASAVGAGATTVQSAARAYSPVDTGRLRDSIVPAVVARDTVVQGIVGSDVSYAPVQEKRKGFLRRALAENVRRVVSLIDQAIGRIVRK